MKNNIVKILFLFVIIVLLTGCDGNVTRDIRHAGYTLNSTTFTCSALMPKDKEDISYEKIKYYNNSYLITEDGEIYEVSIDLKYSNKENCKKAESPFLVDGIFGDIARGKDGSIYPLYKLLLGDKNNLKIQTTDNNTGSYLVLKSDGNIYNYIVSRTQDNKDYVVVGSSLAYSKTEFGGNILDFSHQGNTPNTFIRTDKTVYRLRATNHREKILSFNGTTLITTYGKMFTVAS